MSHSHNQPLMARLMSGIVIYTGGNCGTDSRKPRTQGAAGGRGGRLPAPRPQLSPQPVGDPAGCSRGEGSAPGRSFPVAAEPMSPHPRPKGFRVTVAVPRPSSPARGRLGSGEGATNHPHPSNFGAGQRDRGRGLRARRVMGNWRVRGLDWYYSWVGKESLT